MNSLLFYLSRMMLELSLDRYVMENAFVAGKGGN
mgnify:CR=1 FL=1